MTFTQPSDKADEPVSSRSAVKERILRMRARVKKMMDSPREKELRALMVNDLKFVHEPDAQWDEYTKKARGDKRPRYQFNRLRVTIKRVINNMRNNRPQGKVRAFEDGDKGTAEVYEGMIRNIANQSDFDSITDNAAEYQVAGGYAAWRVVTKYADESAFDQDIFFEGIRNPLCLWCAPESYDMTGSDAPDWFYADRISKAEFKHRWPKAKPINFDVEFGDDEVWEEDEMMLVGEYWWKEPYQTTIHFMSDGKTIDESELSEAAARGLQSLKSRQTTCNKIMSAIYSGDAELEPPTEFAGYNHPWVRVYGDYININGEVTWSGLTRHAKDAQRAFNMGLTSAYETVARAPLSQIWATPKQAEGMAKAWAAADKENLPHQLYNPDPAAPGPPQRIGGAEVPVAQIQMSQIGAEEIKANSGIFDASLGNRSNETSGVALRAREAQGEIATFNYQDNMAKAVARTWKIAIGMIPYVIDTPRAMRILGQDGSEKYVQVNQPDEQGNTLNDLSRGRYDLVVTVGPSFSTQRQEAVESYSAIAQANPQLMPIAGDLIMKAMDLPYSDEIAERIKMMLPEPIQKMMNSENQAPEVVQAMAQADQAMMQVQEHAKMVEAAAAEATQLKTEAEQATAKAQVEKSNVQIAMANLKTEEANFKAMQAQFEAQVAELNGKIQSEMMQIQQGQEKADGTNVENSAALDKINQAADAIAQMADAFLQQAAQVVMEAKQEAPIVIERARATGTRSKRVNGDLVTTVLYDDGTEKQIKASRMNGELLTSVQ